MTHVIDILTNLLAFIFALGVIIVVHEAGHLMVAKAFGVRVMTFSVGFGKRLWGFRRGETDYRLSAVPLGGYVRLGGENPEEVTDDPREFLNKPRWQRILVYVAGPAMNIVLSILLFAVLFMVGIQVFSLPDTPAVVAGVEDGSSAAKAGLKRGDLVLEAKGEQVENWEDLFLVMAGSPEQNVPLVVRRGDETVRTAVTPARIPKHDLGDLAGIIPSLRPQVVELVPGEPAEAAGFRPGDEIRAVDGQPVIDQDGFIEAIAPRAGQQVRVLVVRDNKEQVISVVPKDQGGAGKIGVKIGYFQRYGPAQAFVQSIRYNVQTVQSIFEILGKIFRRELSAKGALTGPIGIAAESGRAVRQGFKYLLHLMGFISISIAVMNLMPIPILDGGQILILAVEGVIRRDLSLRLKEVISQVGFVMILLLMFVVIWFDLVKSLPAGLLPGS
ncbi:MAG TPA: RIP metalloprotease RseP [Thermoanaerobaculia bacterium]|nr:RIP metalloprotease RseP [Thermoanaerobaculia bacterium]